MYMQSKNGLGDWDFGSIVDTLTKGYSSYSQSKAQADMLKQQAKLAEQQAKLALQQQQAALAYQYNPQYSNLYSSGATTGGANMMPLLLLGGLGLAAFLLMRN